MRGYCQDEGPKNICWALGLVGGCLVVRGQINSNEDVRLRGSRASYDCEGEAGRGGVSPQLNEVKVRKCVLSSKVMFQEVLLIRLCIVNVQDKWELGNISGEAATTALNALQLTLWSH